jgi:F-type H+-transporting ATPase subunit epsilon
MIHLTILNLKEKIFDGKVDSVTLPGEQGELTLLPNHVPIVTAMKSGTIRADQKYFESKGGGIFEFNNNVATILL